MSRTTEPDVPTILSGIQPSGRLHLGNYFGMIRPAVALQAHGRAFYFVADLHALTTIRDRALLAQHVRDVALDLLAAGLDPARAVLFRQSDVLEVTELAWILATRTSLGLLNRAHAFKDKVARGQPASVGLFTYPVLMAADILLYDADLVPVGRDQAQHLEITRDIATAVNTEHGAVFTLPKASIMEDVAVVPGIDGQKMSKSYGNAIALGLSSDELRKRVMQIVTDSTAVADPKDSTHSTIVALYRLVASPAEVDRMEDEFRSGGVGYGEFKRRLFEALDSQLTPFRLRREELSRDPAMVNRILEEGADRARIVARQTMSRVRQAVGLD